MGACDIEYDARERKFLPAFALSSRRFRPAELAFSIQFPRRGRPMSIKSTNGPEMETSSPRIGTGGFPAVARSTMKLKGKPEPAESPRRADFQNHHFSPPSNPSTIFFPVKMFPNPAVQVETPPTGRKWHGNFQLFTYRSAAQRVP